MKTPKTKKKVRNFARLRRTQGCLTDCVAYYFNLHPENVPYFVYPREGWMRRLKAYFKKRGLDVWWGPYTDRRTGLRIVSAPSLKWKTSAHSVVLRGNKLVYDPNYPSQWHKQKPSHELIITPLTKPNPRKK